MNTTLVHNYIMDLKKKDIDRYERAEIMKEYIEKEKISQREFGRRFNIPKSTVEDWLLVTKISKEEYKEVKTKNNLTDSDMYRLLRKSKKKTAREIKEIPGIDIELGKLSFLFQNLSTVLKQKGTIKYTEDTKSLISKNIKFLKELEGYIKNKEELKNGETEVRSVHESGRIPKTSGPV